MITPATTRGRGRPRKQPENPDCEPATKGYVKCLMRKITDIKHTHGTTHGEQCEHIGIFTMALSMVSVIGWIVAVRMCAPNIETMFASMFWVASVVFVACVTTLPVDVDEEAMSDYIPDYLKKYEPPCEPKRGCEEQE